jgi:hypothetical protein
MPKFLDTRGRSTLAIGICDRCKRKFPLGDLKPDRNSPGLLVCDADNDEFDPWRKPFNPKDANIAVRRPRPDESIALPAPEAASIEFDSASGGTLSGFDTFSFSHTCGSGENRAVLVQAAIGDDRNVTSITYAGLPMVSAGEVTTVQQGLRVIIFKMVNPPSGSNLIEMTFDAITYVYGAALSFTGANQTVGSLTGTAATVVESVGLSVSVDVSTTARGMVMDAVVNDTSVLDTPGDGQTLRFQSQDVIPFNSTKPSPSGGVVQMSWTAIGSTEFTMIAVPINPA